MRWTEFLVLGWSCFAVAAGAHSVNDALEKTARLLESGLPADALRQCEEARVEYPESARVLFAIGTAQAALAEQYYGQNAHERAGRLWRQARETFGRVAARDADRLGSAAAFNAATCLLEVDKTFNPTTAYTDRVENLRAAVADFEACVAQYPDEKRARKNLDHARYRLNLLLQHPPRDDAQDEAPKSDSPTSAVNAATTQIPGAQATVENQSTVVLRMPGREGGQP